MEFPVSLWDIKVRRPVMGRATKTHKVILKSTCLWDRLWKSEVNQTIAVRGNMFCRGLVTATKPLCHLCKLNSTNYSTTFENQRSFVHFLYQRCKLDMSKHYIVTPAEICRQEVWNFKPKTSLVKNEHLKYTHLYNSMAASSSSPNSSSFSSSSSNVMSSYVLTVQSNMLIS